MLECGSFTIFNVNSFSKMFHIDVIMREWNNEFCVFLSEWMKEYMEACTCTYYEIEMNYNWCLDAKLVNVDEIIFDSIKPEFDCSLVINCHKMLLQKKNKMISYHIWHDKNGNKVYYTTEIVSYLICKF